MSKVEQVEQLLCGAVDDAINQGYLIVSGDWGVRWDASAARWVWDREQFRVRGCCIVGAFLLTQQPILDPEKHKGDEYDAMLMALDCDRWWLRDLLNGCDGYPMHRGHDPVVYDLGMRLNRRYRPMDTDILGLQYAPHSETRLRILPDLESEPDLLKISVG